MDQLTAMRVFARVVEAGTFTRAADTLKMPKPSVTKLVQGLEEHLQVKLLQRTTRRVTVTPEGAAYYERTARLLADLEDIEADVSKAQTRPRGRLRVDAGSSVSNFLLIPALPAFRAKYPDIQLELGVSDRSVDLVGDGVDCSIRGGVLPDQSLVARRIGELEFLACATPAYLKRKGTPAHPTDLQEGHDIVSYFSTRTGRLIPLSFIPREGERIDVMGRSSVAVNESTAHLSAVLAGLGVSQLPAFVARPHLDSGALVQVLDAWQGAPFPLFIVYPQNRHMSVKLRAFVDWTVELFAPFRPKREVAELAARR
ncbi:LysR family transcriptional regulator [Myxococcus qinghaiensis]|uniref:LysR family transcriptional regulator n=1 Tax=Myxococcus qinghaiensis TaxID=2906758 RepID=UPI0020A726FF|nr:LysR family transcriptional regulator [Myxococcus qinghaiensis]MCP3166759.1 LysR substrate-binding domain-containing protein [Myxococcus qinghaiensis]